MSHILLTNADFRTIDLMYDYPMVVTIKVANFVVMKTRINQGCYIDILYWKTFRKMSLSLDAVEPYNDQIVRFAGERVNTQDTLILTLSLAKVMNVVKRLGSDTCWWMQNLI